MPAEPRTIPGPTAQSSAITLARLAVVTDESDNPSEWIDVHFNPASLQLQLSNELKESRNQQRSQYIAKTTAKLTMDLQFDTTDTGEDVMKTTRKLQAFVAPSSPAGQEPPRDPPPPIVVFEWGTLKFKGIAESYRETIDFFSANGVPLRASINLTLSRQAKVFDDAGGNQQANVNAVDAPASSPADAANRLNAPGAARELASNNNEESLRFGAKGSLVVSGGVSLKAPAAFSAGANLSLGGQFGVSASAGLNLEAGLAGQARLSATEGAFAGLRVNASAAKPRPRLDPARLLPQPPSAALATDAGASFQIGGKATMEGAAGLRANVGSNSFSAKVSFDPI